MPAFVYKDRTYEYEVTAKQRKTLGIYVHPDLRIEVRVPDGTPSAVIKEKVHKRRSWIVKQYLEFSQYHPLRTAPVYRNGATHLYLGKQYRLQLHTGIKNEVKLKDGYLHVTSHKDSSPERSLRSWYKDKADEWFPKLLDEMYPSFKPKGIPKPDITHKWLQKRWGSCKVSKQQLLLNTELIQAPKLGIAYVIAHELTHLLHPHHDAAFFATLTSAVPDWEKWKEKLEKVMA